MALYIKANRLVAEHLKVDKLRMKLKDGNYLLWQADMLEFGKLFEIDKICKSIGALALQPWEARQEQDGTVTRELPEAADSRFVIAAHADGNAEDGNVGNTENEPGISEDNAGDGDSDNGAELPADGGETSEEVGPEKELEA